MSRFIEGEARTQSLLFPEQLEDWIAEDNPVRAVDAFVDELDLTELGFAGAQSAATGRPAYHPATLLKIYIYGYLNRIQSSRRLEREAQRNVELVWLTGRLMPDFKTIADFRKDNGAAIRRVCREFVELSRQVGLFTMRTPDQQISLTDPDARSMATSGRGTGIVGYNVQTVVDTQHHMIVAHEVTNVGHDRTQLTAMATVARDAIGHQEMTALADRGYFKGEEILQCAEAGIKPLVPKPLTSGSNADGRFDKRDFIYDSKRDEYRCPAGERAIWRQTTIEKGMTLHRYWPSACPRCPIKSQCTTGDYRRVTRWEHEQVLEAMQRRLDRTPEASRLRRQTVEHPFGTLKAWMGSTHFLTKTLPRVRTEMSLHVLAYNLKRMLQIFGTQMLIAFMKA